MLKQNQALINNACDQFLRNVDDIATFYLSSATSAYLLTTVKLNDELDWEMHLSNNFPTEATTIRTPQDVVSLYNTGDYQRLNSYQAVISLCSIFEVFIKHIGKLLEAKTPKNISITSWRRKNTPVTIRNQTLCLVKSIHDKYEIDSQLINDEALCWIYNFFVIRNAIVHEGGILQKNTQKLLVGDWQKGTLNQYLEVSDNDIDDMVHYLRSHVKSFEYKINDICTTRPHKCHASSSPQET